MLLRTLLRAALFFALSFLFLTSSASAGIRLGGIVVSGGYAHYSVPYYSWYPYYAWDGYWAPFAPAWAPFYDPYFFAPAVNKGEVKLTVPVKNAGVYLDGAFAGTADKLKTFWLDPGAYDLELRVAGQEPLQKRIYVLSGKTLKLDFRRERR